MYIPGTLGIAGNWALQREMRAMKGTSGVFWVGHSRATLRLNTAGILCGGALQEGRLWGWALLGHSAVGQCLDILRGRREVNNHPKLPPRA